MRKIWIAASAYAALGLLAGLLYRTVTHRGDFTGFTQLSVTHTHLLALGMLMMLIVLALDAVLDISGSRSFRIFFATYNAGLVITVGVMVWHGFIQLAGGEGGAAIAGTAGIGHILLTVGIAALMVSLSAPVKRAVERRASGPNAAANTEASAAAL